MAVRRVGQGPIVSPRHGVRASVVRGAGVVAEGGLAPVPVFLLDLTGNSGVFGNVLLCNE